MVDLPFGQEGGKLLADGLDEVWWERGHGRTPSSGSLENSPHDRAACARLSSRLIVSLSAQGLRAPPKKAGRYGAYRAAVHEAQPHLGIELRQVEPITGNGLRIGIIFGDRLLDEAQGLARMAPAVKGRSLASRLNQVSSKKPTTHSGRPSARPINRSRRLFFFCTQGRERLSTVWPAPSAPPSSPKWPGWFRP